MKKKLLGIELQEDIRFLLEKYISNSEFNFSHISLAEYDPRKLFYSGDFFLIIIEKDSLLEDDLTSFLPQKKIPLLILNKFSKEGKIGECIFSINLPANSEKFINTLRNIESKKTTRYIRVNSKWDKKKIIFFDTDTNIKEVINVFRQNGFVVTYVNFVEDLYNKISFENPDILVLNIDDKKEGVLEFIESIRVNEKFKSVPIIVTSTKNEIDDAKTSIMIGADEFLTKPYGINDLIKLIKKTESNKNYLK